MIYIFLQFYLPSLRGKEYFSKLYQQSGAGAVFFWPLGAGAARKKIPGAGAAWEKKAGAGAAQKLAGSPALLKTKEFSRFSSIDLPQKQLK